MWFNDVRIRMNPNSRLNNNKKLIPILDSRINCQISYISRIWEFSIFTIFPAAFPIFTADFSRNYRKFRKLQYPDIPGRLLPELSEKLEFSIFPIFTAEVAKFIENIGNYDFSDISGRLWLKISSKKKSSTTSISPENIGKIGNINFLQF